MKTIFSAAAFWLLLSLSPGLHASSTDDEPRVPVLVVHAGKAVHPDSVALFADRLAGSLLTGQEVAARLGLLSPPEAHFSAYADERFRAALAHFFSGGHREAQEIFLELVASPDSGRARLADRTTREMIFKSHLYLAMISREARDEDDVERHLRQADFSFPGLEPSSVEFPPWVCGRFARAGETGGTPRGKIFFDAPAGCRLSLAGKDLGAGPEYVDVEPGVYAAIARCPGRRSFEQRLSVKGGETRFRPLVLVHSTWDDKSAAGGLIADSGVSPADLVDDLLAVARAGSWRRLVVFVGTAAGVSVWLVDAGVGGVVRKTALLGTDEGALEAAARALVSDTAGYPTAIGAPKPWYKDAMAWSFVGAGAAMIAGGIAIGQVFGSPSREEMWAYTLIAAGSGLMGTGTVLFFFPSRTSKGKGDRAGGVAFGLMAGGRF